MEEYIRLEEEKARKHGKVFNWETTKYAIVYNDAQTSKSDLLTELILIPQRINEFDLNGETSLFEYDEEEQNVLYFNDLFPINIIHPDDLKLEKDNDDNEIDIIQSLRYYKDGDCALMLRRPRAIRHMALPPRNLRHQYLRGLPDLMVEGLSARMLMEHRDAQGTVGFGAYWAKSAIPSYILIRDPILRLCHRLIACSIARTSQTPEKVTVTDLFYFRGLDIGSVNVPYLLARYLRLFVAGRKSGAHISGPKEASRLLRLVPLRPLRMLLLSMRVARLFRHPYRHLSSHHHLQLLLGLCHRGWPVRGCMTRSSTNELFTPYKEPEREFQSSRRHFKTLSLDELRSPDFNLLSNQEYSEEEEAETMAETMEQYMIFWFLTLD
ncbi:hypothetical protein Tco_0819469 [Tanacetum coccineum]|uniref:Uncharacterized protein n=1 Tax=Tanacetum coccineum TaxID=301880 RepID=A0ABQ5A6N4_9ASTR